MANVPSFPEKPVSGPVALAYSILYAAVLPTLAIYQVLRWLPARELVAWPQYAAILAIYIFCAFFIYMGGKVGSFTNEPNSGVNVWFTSAAAMLLNGFACFYIAVKFPAIIAWVFWLSIPPLVWLGSHPNR
jgi:hypothetical protein